MKVFGAHHVVVGLVFYEVGLGVEVPLASRALVPDRSGFHGKDGEPVAFRTGVVGEEGGPSEGNL